MFIHYFWQFWFPSTCSGVPGEKPHVRPGDKTPSHMSTPGIERQWWEARAFTSAPAGQSIIAIIYKPQLWIEQPNQNGEIQNDDKWLSLFIFYFTKLNQLLTSKQLLFTRGDYGSVPLMYACFRPERGVKFVNCKRIRIKYLILNL